MLSSDRLEDVAKLAGVAPKKQGRVSGTRAKLASKDRPSKAAKLRGKIQARSDSSKSKLASRQKSPKRTMYKKKQPGLSKKLSFQRKGESLAEKMRHLLSEVR